MTRWVRVTNKRINIDYGILAEEWAGESEPSFDRAGLVRLTLASGRVLVLVPDDGTRVLRAIDDLIDAAAPGAVQVYEVRQVKPRRPRRPPRADPGGRPRDAGSGPG